MLLTPLEQFRIVSLLPIKVFVFDFSLINLILINIITLTFFSIIIYYFSFSFNYLGNILFFLIPNSYQFFVEVIYFIVNQLLFDNINFNGEKYFPIVSLIFIFILFSNLVGLLPYSFTVTSHLIVTFTLSFAIFIGIIFIGFQQHKIDILSIFIPANTSFILALILVPIEFISYVAKPVSLGVRLFINLMAGHTLLKVIVGFSWSILLLENTLALIHIIPLTILVLLIVLEFCVALIQAYVFTILTCIYLNDCINLH